jgi:hypothetical protein
MIDGVVEIDGWNNPNPPPFPPPPKKLKTKKLKSEFLFRL